MLVLALAATLAVAQDEPTAPVEPGSLAYLDQLPGFRGVKWGEQPSADMSCTGEDRGFRLCKRKTDSMTFGHIPLTTVQYEYGDGGLTYVGMEVERYPEWEAMIAGFEGLFGEPNAADFLRLLVPDRAGEVPDAIRVPGMEFWVGGNNLAGCTSTEGVRVCGVGQIGRLREWMTVDAAAQAEKAERQQREAEEAGRRKVEEAEEAERQRLKSMADDL